MKRLIAIAGLVMLVLGCQPKQSTVEYARTVSAVEVAADVNDGTMTVAWQKSGEGMIGGYNIYISDEPLAARNPGPVIKPSFKPFNEEPFPGDTNPDDGVEYFVAEGLENGVRYFVSVRVVYPDGSVSKPSNEIEVVCGPRGEIELGVRYEADNDGFSFERNAHVEADAVDNDLFFFSKLHADILESPERLNGFLRQTRIMLLPWRGSFESVRARVAETPLTPRRNYLPVDKGDWILIQTPEKKSALIQVLGFTGEQGPERKIKLFYAYSALVGETIF